MAHGHSHCEYCAARIWKPCWWAGEAGLNTPSTCDNCGTRGCDECIKPHEDVQGNAPLLCPDCRNAQDLEVVVDGL